MYTIFIYKRGNVMAKQLNQLSEKELLKNCCDDLNEVKALLRLIAEKLDIDSDLISNPSNFDAMVIKGTNSPNLLDFKIKESLKQLGAPCNLLGYKYLITSIQYIVSNNCDNRISITKELYPYIANLYDTTPSRVERAIRHCVEVIWNRGDICYLQKIFSYRVSSKKGNPTNSEFIYAIAEELSIELS